MNVSDQIIQVLDNLCEKFGIAIDWTSENVFPYLKTLCEKLVTWEIWSSVAWMGFAVLLLTIGITFTVVSIKKFGKLDGAEVLTFFISLFCYIAFVGIIMTQTFDIIKCTTFPEMYIFEYVQRVLNSGG